MKLPKVAKEDLEEGREYIYKFHPDHLGHHVGVSVGVSGALVATYLNNGEYESDMDLGLFKGEFYGPIELEGE